MMILCWSPFDALTSRKPSAPAPPDLLIGTTDCFIRLCLATTPWVKRAIWSAPPPVPAGMMNSTDLVGSHACAPVDKPRVRPTAESSGSAPRTTMFWICISLLHSGLHDILGDGYSLPDNSYVWNDAAEILLEAAPRGIDRRQGSIYHRKPRP